MSSNNESSPYPHLPGYDIENTPYLTTVPIPADPYNWRIQQIGTLNTMGYPVDLEKIDTLKVREIFAALHDGEIPAAETRQIQQNRRWYLPRLTDMDFQPWAEHTIPFRAQELPVVDMDPNRQEALLFHPGSNLPRYVDWGDHARALLYIRNLQDRGVPPVTATPHNRFGGTIIGCYLASVDRCMDQLRHPESVTDIRQYSLRPPNTSEVNTYKHFQQQGHRPATSEAIGALIQDYYLLVEQYVPEFAAFKDSTE